MLRRVERALAYARREGEFATVFASGRCSS